VNEAVLELAMALLERASVTPEDAGCQQLLAERLAALGFEVESMPFGQVTNLWARRGSEAPLLCFAGHTDVVPPGPEEQWISPAFQPQIRDGLLYGRGCADMKGALAAMVCACEGFLAEHPDAPGSIAFLLTSDEEGPAVDGTRKVVQALQARGVSIDHCIVGEPSSTQVLGDTLRVGRRGSLNGRLVLLGVQGHVAFPERAVNPIHQAAAVISALCDTRWDRGHAEFPDTGFQISAIQAGVGASNVIPGSLTMDFNFRYSPASTAQSLQARVVEVLEVLGVEYRLSWESSGLPFHTPDGPLQRALRQAVSEIMGVEPALSTGGGTSDGRFIAPTGAAVVELGLLNHSIHQVNEHCPVQDLQDLARIYQRTLELLLL